MPTLEWQFPPNAANEIEGHNDAGISHFTDNREVNLIRESIQNSLDARAGNLPVNVAFSLVDLPPNTFNARQLREILVRAIQSPHNDETGRAEFNRAKSLLDYSQVIKTLCIADSNTTGADDLPRPGGAPSKWVALTKGSGAPVKDTKDAAGSFGLGKHSAFAVTNLRTVLYSTTWISQNRLHSRFIGKSILVSHYDAQGEPRRRTGYLSHEDYQPLAGGDVPVRFQQRHPGTALFIVGYDLGPDRGTPGWETDVISTAIDHYFHAVTRGNLVIKANNKAVNADNIAEMYQGVSSRTRNFIRVSQMSPAVRRSFEGIGTVSLYIQVYDDPKNKPREIALVRDSGMMITAQRNQMGMNLGSIPSGWRGFTAIVECISASDESSYIRDTESPKHDRLSLDFIADPSRKRQARAALQELGIWVRQQLEERAGLPQEQTDDELKEMAPYLGVVDASKPGNANIPGTVHISGLRQSDAPSGGAGPLQGIFRRERRTRKKTDRKGGTGGDESGTTGGGPGNTGTGHPARRPPVGRGRVRPTGTHSLRITFDNPGQDVAGATLQLVAIGEDGAIVPMGIREAKAGGELVAVQRDIMSQLPVLDGERYLLEIRTTEPITGKTFRLDSNRPD